MVIAKIKIVEQHDLWQKKRLQELLSLYNGSFSWKYSHHWSKINIAFRL